MNRIIKFSQLVCCMFALNFQLNAQNLLSNGSFESGFTGWNNLAGGGGAATYSLSTADKYDGVQAMQASITTTGVNAWDVQSLGPNWTATLGKTYTISLYAKSLVSGGQINIVQQNTSYSSNSLTLTTSWALYQFSYVATEVNPQFKIQFPQKGTFLIDAISIVQAVAGSNNNLTISPSTVYQTVEGFGGSMYYYDSWIANNSNSDSIYRHLFQDLSLDWLRLNNGYSYQTNFNPTYTLKNLAGAKKYNPQVKVMMSTWSPPANLKSNNSTSNGGTLKKHKLGIDSGFVYNQYAQWWRQSIIAYNAAGINISYISLQNEPDFTAGYESCRFNGTEGMSGGYAGIDKAIDSVYYNIKDLSFAPKILGSESFQANPNTFNAFNSGLKNKPYVHGYNYHLYDQNPDVPNSFDNALNNIKTNFSDKPNYMTEYTMSGWFNTAQVINKTMSVANSSAFFYWDVAYPGSQVIDIDCNYNDCYPYTFKYPGKYYSIKPNYYSIKHFSKFIQPGYKHIGGSGTNSNIQSSFYVDPTGSTIVAILINTEAISVTNTLNLTGYKIVGSQVYQSTTGSYFVNKGSLQVGNSLSLPDTSVTTIVMQVQPTQCSASITPAGSTAICQGSSVILNANSGASYVWYNGSSQVGTGATYAATLPGNYTVKVTSATGCSATSLGTTVTVSPLPTLTSYYNINSKGWQSGNALQVCLGDNVYTGPWPTVDPGWSWTGPGNFTSTLRSPVIAVINTNQGGIYTATYKDGNGCSSSLDLNVTVSVPIALITSPSARFCPGGNVTLTASTGTNYLWRNGTTTVGTSSTYIAKTAGSYTVIVSDVNSCKDTSLIKTITISPVPVISITSPANNAVVTNDTFPINTSVTGTKISSVKFYNGTSLMGTVISSPYNFTTPSLTNGTYNFSAIVKNTSNCADTANVTVKVNKVIAGFEDGTIENDNFYVSPNPFTEHTILNYKGTFEYSILDLKGQELEKRTATNSATIGSGLSTGAYFVRVSNGDKIQMFKVVKN